MRLEIVDVFAEAPLKGNQLAVVDLSGVDGSVETVSYLTSGQMQSIAREMNFSETTFVLKSTTERASVRIFTPGKELPFAGHPTLGTAWVLARKSNPSSYILDLEVGPVKVEFDAGGSDIRGSNISQSGICWMSPPMPNVLGSIETADATALLNLQSHQLDPDYPATFMELGPRFAFVSVRDEETLSTVTVNVDARRKLLDQGLAVSSIFVFCKSGTSSGAGSRSGSRSDSRSDYAARMFFDAGGLREDPATGSANSAFAVYLRDLCGIAPGQLSVAQGDYMQRPSRIYLDIGKDSYRVGGRVQSVAIGELDSSLFAG